MSGDDEAGMAWWNGLSERERAKWSALAGNTGRAVDAWKAFKVSQRDAGGRGRELHPSEVIADLLGSDDFPAEVLDTEAAAQIIIQRLIDSGFEIVPANNGPCFDIP
jgi:hypothetical protein